MKKQDHPSKEHLIDAYLANRKAILQAALELPPEAHILAFVGEWTIKELLAHLCGWDHTFLEAFQQILVGELPAFYPLYDPSWKRINTRMIIKYRRDDLQDMQALLEESQGEIVAFLQGISEEEFFKDRGIRAANGYHVTIAGLLKSIVHEEQEHLEQIQGLARSLAQNSADNAI